MAMISLMAAVLCVIGPATIPAGLVPVTLLPFALYMVSYVAGMWKATVSCLIYLCIGMVGLPVFSGYGAGPGVLLGPTGGYLIGYLLITLCSGYFIQTYSLKRMHLLGMVTGLMLCYLIGSFRLSFVAQMSFRQALLVGVVPYMIFDVIKIAVALMLGPVFRKHLYKANVI